VETVQVVNASSGYGPGRLEIRGYGGQGFAARYRVCSSAGAILPQGATIGHLGNVMCQVFALHTLHLHVFHASSRARTHTHTLSLPHTQITISNQGFDYTSGGVVKVFAYACALACKRARTLTVVYAHSCTETHTHANLTCTNVCVSVGHSGRCDADGQSSVSGSHLLHQLEAVTVPLRRVHRPVESQSHIHLFV
jgi:hypothetical protein